MSVKDVIKNSVYESLGGGTTMNAKTVILILLLACLAGIYIYAIYKLSSRTAFYSKDLNITMAGMPVIVAAIMIAMQSNLLVSLGMVGALSIVRFRTAIKEPLDIAFLFWSIAVGIVLAAGMIPLAVIGSVVIGVMLLVFVNRKTHVNPYIVVLQCDGYDSETQARTFLESHAERCAVKSKSARKGLVELNLEVRLKDGNTDFINALSELDGVESAVLVSYNGDYMG